VSFPDVEKMAAKDDLRSHFFDSKLRHLLLDLIRVQRHYNVLHDSAADQHDHPISSSDCLWTVCHNHTRNIEGAHCRINFILLRNIQLAGRFIEEPSNFLPSLWAMKNMVSTFRMFTHYAATKP